MGQSFCRCVTVHYGESRSCEVAEGGILSRVWSPAENILINILISELDLYSYCILNS